MEKSIKSKMKNEKDTRKSHRELVIDFLEKKDRTVFKQWLPKIRKIIGGNAGIYALYKGGNLYYVGISDDLLRRFSRHTQDEHKNKWDKVSFFIIDKHKYSKDIESVILRISEKLPKGNKTKGKLRHNLRLPEKLNNFALELKKSANSL